MPVVSIIVPCRNERRTIGELLRAIQGQDFPSSKMEILIADGMSQDGTREAIKQFAAANPTLRIELVDNPDRHIPAALNRALARARGDIIIRLDAHSVPAPDYVSRCVSALQRTKAANVGGLWQIQPTGPGAIARSIARAGSSPLGAGDARYRVSGHEGPVETVPFGAFPREWLEKLGGYDETLHTNEDYELNYRLRRAGGQVWFDPAIRSSYRSRSGLTDLARQYARYGYWKGRMVRRNPDSLRWRQMLPAAWVLSLSGFGLLSVFFPEAWTLLAVECTAYGALVLGAAGWEAIRHKDVGLFPGMGLALATMHLLWGAAFWVGLVKGWPSQSPRH